MTREEINANLKSLCSGMSKDELARFYKTLKFLNTLGQVDAWVLADFADIYITVLTGESVEFTPVTTVKPIRKSDYDAQKNGEIRDEISSKIRDLACDPEKFETVKRIFAENNATGVKDIPDDKLVIVNQMLEGLVAEPNAAEQAKKQNIICQFPVIAPIEHTDPQDIQDAQDLINQFPVIEPANNKEEATAEPEKPATKKRGKKNA